MKSSAFQNMAPNARRATVLTVVVAAVAACIYMFGVQPCAASLRKAKSDLDQLQIKKSGVDRDLRDSAKVKARLAALDASLRPYEEATLTPLLESWAMRAKSMLDVPAAEAGLKNVDYSEMPVRALPVPKPMARQLYARRPIKVTCTGSYAAIVSFLMRVEKEMPLVSLQAFKIDVQGSPDSQRGELVFEWLAPGAVTTVASAKKGASGKKGGAAK